MGPIPWIQCDVNVGPEPTEEFSLILARITYTILMTTKECEDCIYNALKKKLQQKVPLPRKVKFRVIELTMILTPSTGKNCRGRLTFCCRKGGMGGARAREPSPLEKTSLLLLTASPIIHELVSLVNGTIVTERDGVRFISSSAFECGKHLQVRPRKAGKHLPPFGTS